MSWFMILLLLLKPKKRNLKGSIQKIKVRLKGLGSLKFHSLSLMFGEKSIITTLINFFNPLRQRCENKCFLIANVINFQGPVCK